MVKNVSIIYTTRVTFKVTYTCDKCGEENVIYLAGTYFVLLYPHCLKCNAKNRISFYEIDDIIKEKNPLLSDEEYMSDVSRNINIMLERISKDETTPLYIRYLGLTYLYLLTASIANILLEEDLL